MGRRYLGGLPSVAYKDHVVFANGITCAALGINLKLTGHFNLCLTEIRSERRQQEDRYGA